MAISIDTLKHLSRDQRNFFLIFGLLGLGILMGISLVYLEISDILRGQAERRSYLLAQTASDKDIILRKWVAGLGGIYAPVTPATPPNPWLPEAGRDFTLPGGMRVTRMNPAYVTRLVHALWREHSDIPSRIVSAKPVNPANRALPWEAAALGDIERRGGKEYFILSGDPQKGQVLRHMAALRVEQSCLACHTLVRPSSLRMSSSLLRLVMNLQDCTASTSSFSSGSWKERSPTNQPGDFPFRL